MAQKGQEWPKQVVTDDGGNIYLTGRYSGPITLDGHTLPETSGQDIFLAKFSPQGKALWLRGFEVSGSKDWGHGLAVDAFGNVILTGTIGGTLTIDGNELPHAGGTDILFARFAPDGSTLHASTIGGTNDDAGIGVAIAANGDYILGGGFRGSIEIAQETPSAKGTWMPCSFALAEPLTKSPWLQDVEMMTTAAFAIESGKLVAIDPLNYEVKNEYDVRVRLTDAGGTFIEKELSLTVENAPEVPTSITLDNHTVAENQKKGTTVGVLTSEDEDGGEKHTYQLVDAQEGTTNDNALFTISGTTLKTNQSFDYEAASEYSIRVQVTDRNKLTYTQDLVIHVEDANDTPTGATLSNNEVAENLPADTEIGTLTASDPDHSDVHTFKITGGADNAMFKIQGDKLLTSAALDYETKAELEVIVRVTDDSGTFNDVSLNINVKDTNDAPIDITLDNKTIAENMVKGSVVGNLSFRR